MQSALWSLVPSQVSLSGMQINVIHYKLLTLSLRQILKFLTTVSLIFTAMKLYHLVISERTTHKALYP